ncbi:unnamed protein product [Microthlaspi erraticum]|uniref:Uncharacterized protein n=1 Tax=Microthlaspi erraticum TaxID=1685480 RepID=A0A6D2KYM3_9BRAS|nr:unnamed protein product [Microthlaspi erraticum]
MIGRTIGFWPSRNGRGQTDAWSADVVGRVKTWPMKSRSDAGRSFPGRTARSCVVDVFWSILEHMGQGAWRDLAHGSSSTGYAKEEGRSHLEDQLDRLLDQPVEFLNSTGQASTRSSWKSKSNPKNVASPLTFL